MVGTRASLGEDRGVLTQGTAEPAGPTGARPRGRAGLWRALGVLVVLAAVAPIVHRYLVAYPDDQWQVDLEVYREAGRSLLLGRPVYLFETEVPQLLPFTYPTFSAVLSIPLALMPWTVAGWVWTGFQLLLLYVIVGLAFRPLLDRAGRWTGLAHGLVVAACVWISPVGENIRFGQVNAVLVTLCLLDLVKGTDGLRIGRFTLRWPRGALVGIAVAIKLTPGVFLVHFAITKQWRELRNAVLAAVGVTVATFAIAPEGSLEFWTSALLNSDRLGPNAGSSNQSLRGFVLRLYLSDGATTALWGVLALAAPWPASPWRGRCSGAGTSSGRWRRAGSWRCSSPRCRGCTTTCGASSCSVRSSATRGCGRGWSPPSPGCCCCGSRGRGGARTCSPSAASRPPSRASCRTGTCGGRVPRWSSCGGCSSDTPPLNHG